MQAKIVSYVEALMGAYLGHYGMIVLIIESSIPLPPTKFTKTVIEIHCVA